jgi:hypothetical protein
MEAAPAVDKARRRAAIKAMLALGEELRREGGAQPIPDIVQFVREMRDEQTDRKLKAAGIE